MPEAITRIYSSARKAKDAAAELRRRNCVTDDVTVVTPRDTPDASDSEIVAALRKAGLSQAHAEHYAAFVRQGGTAVSVQPPWGKGVLATQILLSHGPMAGTAPPAAAAPAATQHRAAPGDDGVRRWSDDAAPLSRYFNWPVLSANPAPLSRWLGWRELIDSPTPLSSWLGWRVLSANQGARAGLIDDPAPLSHRVGMPVLSASQGARAGLIDDPAPLSRRLGWRVLSADQGARANLIDNPAPLSTWLGLKVLSSDSGPPQRPHTKT